MATSVPVPMAMPTSAWARAGASLMPSPTMPTAERPLLALQRLDLGGLFAGQHLGHDPADAHLPADRLCGALVVAGDHHHLQAQRLHLADRLGRAVLDRVGHGDDARRLPVHRHQHGRLGLAFQPVIAASSPPRATPCASSSRAVADQRPGGRRPSPPHPGRRSPQSRCGSLSASPAAWAARDDRLAQRMLASPARPMPPARSDSPAGAVSASLEPRRSPPACPR